MEEASQKSSSSSNSKYDSAEEVPVTPDADIEYSVTSDADEDVLVTPDADEEVSVTPDSDEEVLVTPDANEDVLVTPDADEEVSVTPDSAEEVSYDSLPPKEPDKVISNYPKEKEKEKRPTNYGEQVGIPTDTGTDVDAHQQPNVQPAQSTQRRQIRPQRKGHHFRLYFHALVSADLKYDSGSDEVHLHIWNMEKYIAEIKMEFVCRREDAHNSSEIIGDMIMSRHEYYNTITYQYEVKRNTISKKTKMKREDIFEKVIYPDELGKRTLKGYTFTTRDNHIYDGFIYRPPKAIWGQMLATGYKLVKDFVRRTHKFDTGIAAKAHGKDIACSLLEQSPSVESIDEAFDRCNNLIGSLERRYNVVIYKVSLGLLEAFIEVLETLLYKNDDCGIQRKISLSMLILKLRPLVRHEKRFNDVLCRSMLLTYDFKSNIIKEWDVLQIYFTADIRAQLQSDLANLASDTILNDTQGKNAMWMFLIPMIHFLEGTCQPFESVSFDCNHTANIPVWWGVSGCLKKAKTSFKERTGVLWRPPLQQIVDEMKNLFKVDFYLSRSIVASLNLHELKDAIDTDMFPLEVCCAAVVYFLSRFRGTYQDLLEKCLGSILLQLQKQGDCTEQNQLLIGLHISKDMLTVAFEVKQEGIVSKSADIYLWFVAAIEGRGWDDSSLEGMRKDKQSMCRKTCEWIKNQCDMNNKQLHETLQIWDRFLTLGHIPNTVHVNEWTDFIKETLANTMREDIERNRSSRYGSNLVELYCSRIHEYSPELQEMLIEFVKMALTDEYLNSLSNIRPEDYEKLSQLLFQKFLETCEQKPRFDIEAILSWSSLPMYIRVLYQWAKQTEQRQASKNGRTIFSESHNENSTDNNGTEDQNEYSDEMVVIESQATACLERINHVKNRLEHCIGVLKNGSIHVRLFELVREHEQNVIALAELLTEDVDIVKTAIKRRSSELESFHRQIDAVKLFKTVCEDQKGVIVDTQQIDMLLDRDVKNSALSNIVSVSDLNATEDSSNSDTFLLNEFGKEIHDMIFKIQRFRESLCFMAYWNKEIAKLQNDSPFGLMDIFQRVFQPAYQRFIETAESVSLGTITYSDMECFVGLHHGDNYSAMDYDLSDVCHIQNVQERLKQFQNLKELKKMSEVATAIVNVRETCSLSGDFEPMEEISNFDIEHQSLNDDNSKLLSAIERIEHFSGQMTQCLVAFSKCIDLVAWITDVNEAGITELKVFVDLAMMSAGDDPEKISRVQSLHVSANGYSSLIFDLDQNSSWLDLLEKCQPVWEELQNTPTLAEKLDYANRHLDWFKEVKGGLGTVEFTSFVQAQLINERGIYKIGRHVWDDSDNCSQDFLTTAQLTEIGQVLKLTVLKDKNQEVPREYKYDKLQDLQSRLMLVSGKTEQISSRYTHISEADRPEDNSESVERFSTVLDGVVQLCQIYMKLVNSGCMLFQDFAVKLYCNSNPDRPVCAILEFGSPNNHLGLKCIKTDKDPVEDILRNIASCLEKCNDSWIKYVDVSRKEFAELNYFTTEQLVKLQMEIAKINRKDTPSKMIYPLLHVIKQECSQDDLKEAYESATEEVNKRQKNEPRVGSINIAESANENQYEIDKKKTEFIQSLESAGFDNLIAIALRKFPDYNTSDAICWCMLNKDAADEPEAEQENSALKLDECAASIIPSKICTTDLINRAIHSDSEFDRCVEMLAKLDDILKNFLQSISSNVMDIISLKHLGIILHQLSKKEEDKFNRRLPNGYSDNEPNLVVCQTDEIWIQTLSLYLSDENHPLPQSDEVLTCSEATTTEQVDIFLRRAFFCSEGKIHCCVNADKMTFTVCEALEQLLQMFQRASGTSGKYRLVFMCASESEHQSFAISALDRFRRVGWFMNLELLAFKLQNALRFPKLPTDSCFAAAVDFDRSTVRVIKSVESGNGKTLYVKRSDEELQRRQHTDQSLSVSIPLHERNVNTSYITKRLIPNTLETDDSNGRIFHIDITDEVHSGVDYLLFNLLILGCLTDVSGYVWRKFPRDLYFIETRDRLSAPKSIRTAISSTNEVQMLKLLPSVTCRSPKECLDFSLGKETTDFSPTDRLFDVELYESGPYKRTYQCLKEVDKSRYFQSSQKDCMDTLLRHCGISNPSWSEIHHFVKFLNTQLLDFEKSIFVSASLQDDLPGFRLFVQRFLVQMSRDFSSRSLDISEETIDGTDSKKTDELRDEPIGYIMKRKWELSPHPYLFFNADRQTFTFLGFNINRLGDLVDQRTERILEERIISRLLLTALSDNKVPIMEDFDILKRSEKIARMCKVIGVKEKKDSIYDKTYELTADNSKKILAVYMRFRCDIPVIIMGETGCGKTRLVKFLCELMMPRDEDTHRPLVDTNMIIMKVHGGVTAQDIKDKVKDAEKIAEENCKHDANMYTVLFFDEANTTESIGLIKEIVCDKSMEGKPLQTCNNLKFVAACNPYRRHSDELITKLEKAGLGYHVHANETKDKFGNIPMRRLVYRVQRLPRSLLPFVWDFGQLSTEVEQLYIRQMVRRYMEDDDAKRELYGKLLHTEELLEVICSILTESQRFMRNLKDECSFVSLRDVERVLQVMCWFYTRCTGKRTMFVNADKKLTVCNGKQTLNDETRCLLLALGLCYHASLTNRSAYRDHIARFFRSPCELSGGPNQILDEIDRIQEVFLDSVDLPVDIARNQALKENVFMMTICIELRIPLFLVGKPGSSKSLAKIIVTDAMQGRAAKKELFKELKQVQMVSFQCSPLSTPAGILSTFRHCARYQEQYQNNLDKFVSVVILDEIGLAEDSPRMPLKTLHPLLEDGCPTDESPEAYKKVAFIGISNWSLDPAKMNRGLFVQREVPDQKELLYTGRGICPLAERVSGSLIEELSVGYLNVFQKASEEKREFYGLRDFYSMLKMIKRAVTESNHLSYMKIKFAVMRNFGGLESLDTTSVVLEKLKYAEPYTKRRPGDPDTSFNGMMESWLQDRTCDSRYLLLLTDNYSALQIFQQKFLEETDIKPTIIFGSNFRRDLEYTQVCRNINKVKMCMEIGSLIILVNSDNLYESLYDALNQYYVKFGGEQYVDLGLGTHRVKCPVHKNFKLIVVADKKLVYERFPIPLINRLEKHCLSSNMLLTEEQKYLADSLREWVEDVTKESLSIRDIPTELDIKKFFIGFHQDVPSIIALQTWTVGMDYQNKNLFDTALSKSKEMVLWCAAPDAIVRTQKDREMMMESYWKKQTHECLTDYLEYHFKTLKCSRLYAQITTHSTLLRNEHMFDICKATGIAHDKILYMESLTSYDTEQQFINKIKDHTRKCGKEKTLVIIQCESGDINADLIACSRYSILDECRKMSSDSIMNLLFIVQLIPMENRHFQSIQGSEWHSAHIDSLYIPIVDMPSIPSMMGKQMSRLISLPMEGPEARSIDQEGMESGNEEKALNIHKLICRSTPRAVSMIRDPQEDIYRSTERLSLLLSILQGNEKDTSQDSEAFVRGISILVRNLMASRINVTQETWLEKEASSPAMIQKFGTLRRACLHMFDAKLSPILAGVFALLDTSQNLRLLEFSSNTWQKNVWLNLLGTIQICDFVCENLMTDAAIQTNVYALGFGGRAFQCRMPFSWILQKMFVDILSECRRFESQNDWHGNYPEIIDETSIAKVLNAVPREHFEEIVEAYIFDFVQTLYPEEKDRNLVCISVKHFANTAAAKDPATLSSLLTSVHVAYNDMEPSLKYFRDFCSVWDGCNNAIRNRNGSLREEHDLAMLALVLTLESISPKDNTLEENFDTPKGRDVWLETVHRYRHVISQTLNYFQEKSNASPINGARSMWNRIVVMQLFMENVCLCPDSKLSAVFRCRPLWALLTVDKTEVDLKTIGSLRKVEMFLGLCTTTVKDEIKKKAKKCQACGAALAEERKMLTCEHEICAECVKEIELDTSAKPMCPVCRKPLLQDWNTTNISEEDVNSWMSDRLKDYRQRCSKFLMQVISQLCFSNNTAPEREAIDWLISHSLHVQTGAERKTADIGLDSTYVFKAFLFKHLVRTNEQELRIQLGNYIETTEGNVPLSKELEDVILVVMHSIEDKLCENMKLRKISEVRMATECLDAASESFKTDSSAVDQVYAIAQARVGLAVSAKYIKIIVLQETHIHKQDIEHMLSCAESLCNNRVMPWIYLLRCITRDFGTDIILSACRNENESINWINKDTMDEEISTVDMYNVYGEEYTEINDWVFKTLKSKDKNLLQEFEETISETQCNAVILELAVQRILLQVPLGGFETASKDEPIALDRSKMEKWHLDVDKNTDNARAVNVKCLIFHWICVIKHLKENCCHVLQPFIKLARDPLSAEDTYLPTMPQDEFFEQRQMVMESASYIEEKTVYYQCPNGHRYEIGNCGRPWTLAKCFCGADIGGKLHDLLQNNRMDDGTDNTMKGHCLGNPNLRQTGAVPERSLTPIQCAMARMILHCTMYQGCGDAVQEICLLVNPKIGERSMHQFLWDHILLDIEDIRTSLSLNMDDVLMVCHGFMRHIYDIARQKNEEEFETRIHTEHDKCAGTWLTKESRQDWEEEFVENYCQPFLKNTEQFLEGARKNVQGSCKFYNVLSDCETDEFSETGADKAILLDNPNVWKNRTSVSVSHLRQAIQKNIENERIDQEDFPVLRSFLDQAAELQSVRFVPSILKFHSALLRRYNFKINRKDASKITIEQLRREKIAGDETDNLIDDVMEVWNLTRHALKSYGFRTGNGRRGTLPFELSNENMTDDTSIDHLLPTMQGKGVCTFALLDWLINCHNGVIEQVRQHHDYCSTTVQPKAVTSAHLISFQIDQDLLPIILADSSMSTKYTANEEYDFEAIENRIIERFISTKSIVVVDMCLQIDLMTYKSDISISAILKSLHKRIPQKTFETAVKATVCSEIRDVPVISHTLSSLVIVISFLNVTGGNAEDSLNTYMVERLKMVEPVLTEKMQQVCQLKHVKSLWMTLSLHKSDIMVRQKKPIGMIFENVNEKYHKDVPPEVEQAYMQYLQSLSKQRLHQLLELLFEFINAELTKEENEYDDDYVDKGKFKLKHCLEVFAHAIDKDLDLTGIPLMIICEHSLYVWMAVSQTHHESREERS